MAERLKVWVNDDLMHTLKAAGSGGNNAVAEGLWHKLERAVDRSRCAETGFCFAGWTLASLTEPEVHCLKRLRPSCFMPEDA